METDSITDEVHYSILSLDPFLQIFFIICNFLEMSQSKGANSKEEIDRLGLVHFSHENLNVKLIVIMGLE